MNTEVRTSYGTTLVYDKNKRLIRIVRLTPHDDEHAYLDIAFGPGGYCHSQDKDGKPNSEWRCWIDKR